MTVKEILNTYKKVHVLGISPKPERDSYKVAFYLKNNGFEVVGIRPGSSDIDGITIIPSIDPDQQIEILDVFRASEHIPEIVEKAIEAKVKVLWLQLGVSHPEAEQKARLAGIDVISDECIKILHRNLF